MSRFTPKRLVASVALAVVSVGAIGGVAIAHEDEYSKKQAHHSGSLINVSDNNVSIPVNVSGVSLLNLDDVNVLSNWCTSGNTAENTVIGSNNDNNDAQSNGGNHSIDDCQVALINRSFDHINVDAVDNVTALVGAAVGVLSHGTNVAF